MKHLFLLFITALITLGIMSCKDDEIKSYDTISYMSGVYYTVNPGESEYMKLNAKIDGKPISGKDVYMAYIGMMDDADIILHGFFNEYNDIEIEDVPVYINNQSTGFIFSGTHKVSEKLTIDYHGEVIEGLLTIEITTK